jgi:hypothetical protein
MCGRTMFLASALVSGVTLAISPVGPAHAAGDAAGSRNLTGSTAPVNGAAAPQVYSEYKCSFVYGRMTLCGTTINVEPGEHLYARNPVHTWDSAHKFNETTVGVNICARGANRAFVCARNMHRFSPTPKIIGRNPGGHSVTASIFVAAHLQGNRGYVEGSVYTVRP